MPPTWLHAFFLLSIVLSVPAQAFANGAIYGFVDEDGVEHFSNVPDDQRYKLILADRLAPATAALKVPRGVFALPYEQRPFHSAIHEASRSTGIDAALLHAVISVESGYRDRAVSPKVAAGLMQLMPATARRYGLADPQVSADASPPPLKPNATCRSSWRTTGGSTRLPAAEGGAGRYLASWATRAGGSPGLPRPGFFPC